MVRKSFQICPGKFLEDNDYNKKEEEDEDAKDKYVVWCIGAWVTWPERPKGAKDKVKMPEVQKAGLKGRQLEVGAQGAPRLLWHDFIKW